MEVVPFFAHLLLDPDDLHLFLHPAEMLDRLNATAAAMRKTEGYDNDEDSDPDYGHGAIIDTLDLPPTKRRTDTRTPQLVIASSCGYCLQTNGQPMQRRGDGQWVNADGKASQSGSARAMVNTSLVRLAGELGMLPELDLAKESLFDVLLCFQRPRKPLKEERAERERQRDLAQELQKKRRRASTLVKKARAGLGVSASTHISFVRHDVREADEIRRDYPVVFADEGPESFNPDNAKPNPGGVETALRGSRCAGADLRRVLMVTSAEWMEDKATAKNAGVDAIRAADLFSGEKDIESALAGYGSGEGSGDTKVDGAGGVENFAAEGGDKEWERIQEERNKNFLGGAQNINIT